MATQAQVNEFINKIAPILQAEAKKKGYKIVSPAISQALQESLSSKSKSGISQLAEKYHNYHGMKCGNYWLSQGKPSICLGTNEEYKVGTLTPITDFFRVYSDMESGLKGYYEFLDMKRYAAVKDTATPEAYMNAIKAVGYCTSSTYVENCLSKISKYNLTQYDSAILGKIEQEASASIETVSAKVKYIIGHNYTLQADMYVRKSPNGYKKPYAELTVNAKIKGYADSEGNGILRKGTVVTCKGIEQVNGAIWIEIPSGCVCAQGPSGKIYIRTNA